MHRVATPELGTPTIFDSYRKSKFKLAAISCAWERQEIGKENRYTHSYMNFHNHAQPNYSIYNGFYCSHVTQEQDEQNHRNVNYQSTNCGLLLCEPQQSTTITQAASAQEECKSVTAEFQVREATFPRRAETAMNSDTTQPIRTFQVVQSQQMSEITQRNTRSKSYRRDA